MADVRGTLTPKSNSVVEEMRFSGNHAIGGGGHGSVLVADIRKSGEACLALYYSTGSFDDKLDHFWAVMLTNEQRKALAEFLGRYQSKLFEHVSHNGS